MVGAGVGAAHVDAAARLEAQEQLPQRHRIAPRMHPQTLHALVAGVVAEAVLYCADLLGREVADEEHGRTVRRPLDAVGIFKRDVWSHRSSGR